MSARISICLGLLALPLWVSAQTAPAPAPAPAAPGAVSVPRETPEPNVRQTVVEDDNARIEELRVRGEVRSITVQPKVGIKQPYQVVPADGGRDISAGPSSARGAAGHSVWRVLNF